MSDPVSQLLLSRLSINEMADRLMTNFGGNLEDAKIIAQEMSGMDSKIGIHETREFWKTFALRGETLSEILRITGGYTPGELADLFKQGYWCGNCSSEDFNTKLTGLPRGSILVRTSKQKDLDRTPFVLGIHLDTPKLWKYFQDALGFMEADSLAIDEFFEEKKKYRLLQDLVRDWSKAQGYPIVPEEEGEVPTPYTETSADCIVCMNFARDTLLLPCRHLNICEVCAERIDTCPTCRVRVESRIKAFVS